MSDCEVKRTVGEVSKVLGISVRTLHYWESRGLITPSGRTWADYRIYSEQDVRRLEQIMIYRAAGMPLEKIPAALSGNPITHLQEQLHELIQKKEEINKTIELVERLLENAMSEEKLSITEIAQIIGQANLDEYQKEAEGKWGQTKEWIRSQETISKMSREEWGKLASQMDEFNQRLALAKNRGVPAGSDEANILAEEHLQILSTFFPATYKQQVLIARGYVADPRFHSYYEKVTPGLAKWLQEIINSNAQIHGVDSRELEWS
ncbi:MerR family transcriptional regulator [Actinomycetaceae bacterium TAE3-ERU4]|nr:MerR family transcriptional regulator [Actinomycetaceae bacterium TAE3-ERU4]